MRWVVDVRRGGVWGVAGGGGEDGGVGSISVRGELLVGRY